PLRRAMADGAERHGEGPGGSLRPASASGGPANGSAVRGPAAHRGQREKAVSRSLAPPTPESPRPVRRGRRRAGFVAVAVRGGRGGASSPLEHLSRQEPPGDQP